MVSTYGDSYYIDDDGQYYESNDAGWEDDGYGDTFDYEEEYYEDYDPWSDPETDYFPRTGGNGGSHARPGAHPPDGRQLPAGFADRPAGRQRRRTGCAAHRTQARQEVTTFPA